MPTPPSDSSESGTCTSCKAGVRFATDSKTGALTCPVCGARQGRAAALDLTIPKPRAGRRVVDIDSSNAKPQKAPQERTRAQSKQVAAVKRELSSHRPASGALDGTGSAGAWTPPRQTRPEGPTGKGRDDDLRGRWKALTDGLMSRDGRPHRAWDTYNDGEVVLHTKFGMGVVENIDDDGVLTVLFRNGYEELRSGMARDDAG